MRKDDIRKLVSLANALDSLGFKAEADMLDGVLKRIANDEKEYTYSVEMEKRLPGEEEGDEENYEKEMVVSDAKGTLNDILHDAKKYNIWHLPQTPDIVLNDILHDAKKYNIWHLPQTPLAHTDNTYYSENHDEDRDLWEKGIKKFYSMWIDGTPEEKQEVYDFLKKHIRGK